MDDPTNPEILLISAVVQTGDITAPGDHGITGAHFHSHRSEWEWIEQFVFRHSKVPDKATFRSQFPDFPLLKTTDVNHGAEEVERSHLRYALSTTIRGATTHLVDNDPSEALNAIRSALIGIDNTSGVRNGHFDVLRSFDPILEEAQRRVEMSTSLGYAGVTFGFQTLNERTGGMHPGDLAIWAARLGQGKTWMLCKVTAEALLAGKTVSFVSLEQSQSQIAFRIHVLLARALGYDIRHRDLMQGTNMDISAYRSFLLDLPDRVPGKLYISDPSRGRATPFTLATLMERQQPDLMVIDYLTLMQQEGDDWRGARKLSADTKAVGSQYGVPILAAAQINRAGEGGRRPPGTANLAENDGIGQDADIVITQKKDSESVIQVLLAKNRSGQDGQVFHVAFEPNTGRIEEVPADVARTLIATDMEDDD